MKKFKYGVFYTDGGYRERTPKAGGGIGIHGFMYNELHVTRFPKVPAQITPLGYVPKLTGNELKDANYDPVYEVWDQSITAKYKSELGPKKAIENSDVTVVDYYCPNGNDRADKGELLAFIHLLEQTVFECEYLIIYSDSEYLVKGINEYLPNWIAQGWRKSDGNEIANLELWKRIELLLHKRNTQKLKVVKIKAHAGHYGNECADRNATMGVAVASLTGANESSKDHRAWILTPVTYNEYWEPSKVTQPLLRQKWNYAMSDGSKEFVTIDGTEYRLLYMGDHSKSTDDVELLGKRMSDAGFSIILNKEPFEYIDNIRKQHISKMWANDTHVLHRSELMTMVHCINIDRPRNTWEYIHGNINTYFLNANRNDMSYCSTEDIASKVIRPPKLSFKIQELFDEHKETLLSYHLLQGREIHGVGNVIPRPLTITGVTEFFYDTTETKTGVKKTTLSDNYQLVTKSITLQGKQPLSDSLVDLIFTVGTELPSRSIMKSIEDENPKVSIVTWAFDGKLICYGMIIDCDLGSGLWYGYASNRLVTD